MFGGIHFSGPFGTGIGGDVFHVSDSPQMDPLHLFATNQPGGKNYNALHHVVEMGKPIQMGSGFSPQQLMSLMGSYNTFLQNLGAPLGKGGVPQLTPGSFPKGSFHSPDPHTLGALSQWKFGPYGGGAGGGVHASPP